MARFETFGVVKSCRLWLITRLQSRFRSICRDFPLPIYFCAPHVILPTMLLHPTFGGTSWRRPARRALRSIPTAISRSTRSTEVSVCSFDSASSAKIKPSNVYRQRSTASTCELERKAHARPRFAHCAARYLDESRDERSFDVIALHVRLLISHLAGLEVKQIHDATLKPFIADRLAAGVSATTINRSLEVVRTILNRAARAYRDDNGRPLLEAVPPLITMLPESPRLPYPITWDEQDRLFPKLPAHLGRMVLFAVNTGLRDSNVCGLEWAWEVPVPEVGRSVFVIPPEAFKAKRAHVVILNDAA